MPCPAVSPADPTTTELHHVSVAIAATHPAVRSGLQALVGSDHELAIVATADDARGAARSLLQHHPDVLLLAITGSLADNGAMVRKLRTMAPDTAVVVTRTTAGDAYMSVARDAGAAALVPLDGPADDLLAAVRAAGRHVAA
jgi:DNA-binding NarL/FixJ family response regulator